MTQQTYRVDDLLSLSRIPQRFYMMITGEQSQYENPGIALMSYLVAKCLTHEMVDIKEPQLSYVKECEIMSSDVHVLKKIVDSLITSAAQLVSQINGQPTKLRNSLFGQVQELHLMGSGAKMAFDSLIGVNQSTIDKIDLQTISGMTFKHTIFTLQDKIEEVANILTNLTPTPTPEYA